MTAVRVRLLDDRGNALAVVRAQCLPAGGYRVKYDVRLLELAEHAEVLDDRGLVVERFEVPDVADMAC